MNLDYRKAIPAYFVNFSDFVPEMETLPWESSAVKLATLLIHFLKARRKPPVLNHEARQCGENTSPAFRSEGFPSLRICWSRRGVQKLDWHIDPCGHQVRDTL